MSMQSTFPIRFGLQLPRGENVQAVEVLSEGGLDLTQSVIATQYGCASALTNFEVSLTGGYRRINGFYYYSKTIVPGSGPILGVAVYFPGFVIAARQNTATTYSIYSNTGTTWTKLNTSPLTYSFGMVVQAYPFNWAGTQKLIFTDGVNPAYTWDGTNFTILNGTGSAANPLVACAFNGYMFVAGYSSNGGAVKISAPLNETDWQPVDGAAEIVIGDSINQIRIWRNQLIIFCRRSIFKITGNSTNANSSTPFIVQPVTTSIGCVEGRTVQECDGDLIYLSQDGIRTISGTFNIGDTEIASISRPIQQIVSTIIPHTTPLHAVVIGKKTQYRLFLSDPVNTTGIIGAIRRFRDGKEGWEWGQLSGFGSLTCVTSGYMADTREYIIHGDTNGYVYRQENNVNSFNGQPINEVFKTVPFDLGDRALRKTIYRISLYIAYEGQSPGLSIKLVYDYGKTDTVQPDPYLLSSSSISAYDSGIKYDSGKVYASGSDPLIRQLVQGSGFISQFQFNSSVVTAPYVIQGFTIEYFPSGRR